MIFSKSKPKIQFLKIVNL